MTEASEWIGDKLVLSCPSDSAALIFCLSASSAFLKKSKKLVCPVIEYWVRAIRSTRIDSTSVSRGYGKQNIFRDHESNGEHNKQICEWKTMTPRLRSSETGVLYVGCCAHFEAAAGASHSARRTRNLRYAEVPYLDQGSLTA